MLNAGMTRQNTSLIPMNVKKRFAHWLRKVLLRFDSDQAQPQPFQPSVWPTAESPAPAPTPPPAPPQPVKAPVSTPPKSDAPSTPTEAGDVELPLQPILEKLPADLRARLTVPLAELGEASISIPASRVLPQLATGAVRVAFGQLRGAAPTLFNLGDEYDAVAVTLPLDLVLARLSRRWLSREGTQKKMETPKEIGSVFVRRIAGTEPAANPVKAAPVPAAPAPRIPSSETELRLRMASMPSASPVSPTRSAEPIMPAMEPITPAPVAAAPKPVTSSNLSSSIAPPVPRRETPPKPFVSPQSDRSAAPAAPAPNTLAVPLRPLAEKWPAALRNEMAQFDLLTAHLVLPLGTVEAGMKCGRVIFAWRDLRTWIRPNPLTGVSINDATELELPLKIIAPLFLAHKAAPARRRQSLEVDNSIPNLFVNAAAVKAGPPPAPAPFIPPPPISEPAPVPLPALKPAEPKIPVAAESIRNGDDPAPHLAAAPVAEAEIVRRRPAAPDDVVRRAMSIKGVEGAMIVLHEGLMVACELPPYLKADTAGAFLPQIFDRLSHCTNELRMGPLANVQFRVGSVLWRVFRLNSVYFAVFGREGELPSDAQLASLAAELDRIRQ